MLLEKTIARAVPDLSACAGARPLTSSLLGPLLRLADGSVGVPEAPMQPGATLLEGLVMEPLALISPLRAEPKLPV